MALELGRGTAAVWAGLKPPLWADPFPDVFRLGVLVSLRKLGGWVQNATGRRERGRTCLYITINVVSPKGNSKLSCPQPVLWEGRK